MSRYLVQLTARVKPARTLRRRPGDAAQVVLAVEDLDVGEVHAEQQLERLPRHRRRTHDADEHPRIASASPRRIDPDR
jgi:hypothetical protein